MHEFSVSQVSRGLPFLDSSRARGWHGTTPRGTVGQKRGVGGRGCGLVSTALEPVTPSAGCSVDGVVL